jgi:hypothetical protein
MMGGNAHHHYYTTYYDYIIIGHTYGTTILSIYSWAWAGLYRCASAHYGTILSWIITETYSTDEEKAAAFSKIFFLLKLLSLPPMEDDRDPRPAPLPLSLPHEHQIIRKIVKSSSFKAPGNDGIPNIVLKSCITAVVPLLLKCLHAIIRLQYFPSMWREWTIIVLWKPGWDNYTIPKAIGLSHFTAPWGKSYWE